MKGNWPSDPPQAVRRDSLLRLRRMWDYQPLRCGCLRLEKEALTSPDAQRALEPGRPSARILGVRVEEWGARGHREQEGDSTFVKQIVTVLRGDRQGRDDAPTHTLSEAAPLPTPSPWTLPATEPCPGSMNLHTFASPAAHSRIRFWTINSWRVAPGQRAPRGGSLLSARLRWVCSRLGR